MANSLLLEAKVEELGDKCAQYTEEHGTDSPDLLIDYGRALFALAKSSASLVDSQKMDEKHLPLENPKVKVADFDNAADGEPNEGDKDAPEEGAPEEQQDQPQEQSVPQADTSEEPLKVGEADESEEDEDDFVAAFSVVDGARVLLEKELSQAADKKPVQTKLAEARELLGDISLEDDNAQQAIEDYTEAVELKRVLYGALSSPVSEAEFVLSLAYDAVGEQARALEHLKLAAQAASASKMPSAPTLEQRAKDLEAEVEESRKHGDRQQEAKQATAESISGRSALANAVQSLVSNANDISHLTRKRKRPAADAKQEKNKKEEKKEKK